MRCYFLDHTHASHRSKNPRDTHTCGGSSGCISRPVSRASSTCFHSCFFACVRECMHTGTRTLGGRSPQPAQSSLQPLKALAGISHVFCLHRALVAMTRLRAATPFAVCIVSAALRSCVGTPLSLATCELPGALRPEVRRNLTILGRRMSLGIQWLPWPSALLVARLFEILVGEVLGIQVALFSEAPSSLQALWALGGCVPRQDGTIGLCDSSPADDRHITLEVWDSNVAGALDEMRQTLGDRMPVDYGSIGYSGFETLFVPAGLATTALSAEGLPLQFYRSYNTTWHDPARYFQRYTDVPLKGLLPCSKTRFYNAAHMKQYLQTTSDVEGVETMNGRVVAKCAGGSAGFWWFAPACRQDPSTCIPAIDGGDGWFLDVSMQRAVAYNMPLALAVGTYEHYSAVPLTVDMLFYWWSPDNTFLGLLPAPIKFPQNDRDEWSAGIKVTESAMVTLRKWTHHALPSADQRLMEFVERFSLSRPQLQEMMHETLGNKTEGQIACEWLKANPKAWMQWIPFKTDCVPGFGLIDTFGAYVRNRSGAASCEWCRAGTYSTSITDGSGETSVCIECGPGKHTATPGQVECSPCESGSFAAAVGLSACQPCPAGQVSAASGATFCHACGPGSFQAVGGKTSCEACKSGSFQPDVGSTACGICSSGMYSEESATACANCTAGSIAEKAGSSACVACRAGYYAEEQGLSKCSPCDVGWYAADVGLTSCEACGGGAPLWTTMRRLQVADQRFAWVSTDAADSVESCGCAAGARLDSAGRCISCEPEGVDCAGMGVVIVRSGYYSPANLSIFKCGNERRCPGGPPGATCAAGRVGVLCGRCAEGMTPADGGICAECDALDTTPFLVTCIGVPLACLVLYTVFDRSDGSHSRYGKLLIGVSLGLLVGMMQQFSVLGLMNITFVEPMQTFLTLVRVLAFDLDDFLRLGCVGAASATGRFTSKLGMVLATINFIVVLHVLVVIGRHRGKFRQRWYSLVAALGTLGLIFFTSITVLILQPFQCKLHPNGTWTVSAYEDVICWPSEGGEHGGMITLAIIVIFAPLSCFAMVAFLVRRYPQAVRRSDTEFLKAFGFLFIRFRPQSYWYILAIMTRSLFIGLVPVVPRASAQIYLLQVALLTSFALVIHNKPWRVPGLNWLDVFLGAIMLIFLNIASFMALVVATDYEVIGWLCVTMVIVVAMTVPVMLVSSVIKRFIVASRRFRFFLCHHKAEAGAFARWLKIELVGNPKISGDTFLDSDNLESLHQLLNFVASDVQTLLVLGSASIYQRPWCLGEMATAYRNGWGPARGGGGSLGGSTPEGR